MFSFQLFNLLTGAVKITPAHDKNDFEVGKKYALKAHQVIDESGKITSICEEFQGTPRFEARQLIINRLQDLGLYRGAEDHKMLVPVCRYVTALRILLHFTFQNVLSAYTIFH